MLSKLFPHSTTKKEKVCLVHFNRLQLVSWLGVDQIRRRREKEEQAAQHRAEIVREITGWLSPDDLPDNKVIHDNHFKERFGKTGQWLLGDPKFTNWRDGPQSGLLWCHGARKSWLLNLLVFSSIMILTQLLWCSGLRKNRSCVCLLILPDIISCWHSY